MTLLQTSPFRCGRNWTERVWSLSGLRVAKLRGLRQVEPEIGRVDVVTTHYTAATLIPICERTGARAVLIQRDPRDAMISYYHWRRFRVRIDPRDFCQQFEDLLHWAYFQFHEIPIRFLQDAPQHVAHVLRYEDMIADRRGALSALFRNTGVSLSDEAFDAVVARSSFHAMTGGRNNGEAMQAETCRKGVTGEWFSFFHTWHIMLYKNRMGEAHRFLGYGDPSEPLK